MTFKSSWIKGTSCKISLEQFPIIVFIGIGLLAAFHHSLWRDEMQGWLVAWRSENWIDLWKNNAPSGHPVLWSALVYVVRDVTKTPLSMQLLHWFLGSIALLIFWRWNPLPSWQKALFTFGYYPFWEYYFVCRHYVLAELFIFIFCSAYPLRRKTYIPSALCIGLLANTHAFAWSLAFAAFVALFSEWYLSSYQRNTFTKNNYWMFDMFISLSVLILLTTFSAFSLLQVREAVDIIPSNLDFRHLLRVLGRIFGGYVLVIPNHERWFDLLICSFLSIGFVGITLSFLRRSVSATLFFLTGFGFLFAFNFFLYLGVGSRHYGYYFLILIASVWLALQPQESSRISLRNNYSINLLSNRLSNFFPKFLTFCLAIHLAAGVHRALYDFYVPYSAGKVTAEYIQDQGWIDQEMFGTRDVEVSTVSGYLDKDIYYPELKGWGSYTQWNNRISLDRKETLLHLKYFFTSHPNTDRLLLILSKASAFREMQPGEVMINGGLRITADQKFERSWVNPERYYLYWAERNE